MEAFQVLSELLEGDLAQGGRNALPLVGRDAEIEELLQAWERVKAGRGQSVQITGEPGIGKSRLALELIDKIGLRDDSIVVLQASAQHQNAPLHPIIRRLEQRIGIRADEAAEVNASRLCEFLARVPECDPETPVLIGQLLALPVPQPATATLPDAQELRRKTRECVVQLLASPANGDAGLILVEDFHWLDPSTAEVVERIATGIGDAPILLLITSRASAAANGSANIRRIPLHRLADADCRNLADCAVADIAGDDYEPELEVDLFSLMSAFQAVVQRARLRPKVLLPPEQLSVDTRIEQLLARLSETEACGFDDLFADIAERSGLIVTFLALLEMIRLKLVRVFQSGSFGPIRVYKRSRPADAPHPIGDPEGHRG